MFSKNMKIKESPILQDNWMEEKLKNRIWNVINIRITPFFKNIYYIDTRDNFICAIWDCFWYRIDKIPNNLIWFSSFLERNIFNERFHIYDFIEFFYGFIKGDKIFKDEINRILKEENSAFQLIESWDVIPITDDIEKECIEESLEVPYENVRIHIKTAIQHFKEEPKDYRNSIKESISAVEAMCCELTWDSNASLWKALRKLNSLWIEIHPSLEKWFECIYWYTSDESWIRHKLDIDSIEATFEDAKYMLVSCCAFINYLIWKHNSKNL